MFNSTNSISINTSKNYWDIFKKNLVLGYNVGLATVSSTLSNAPPLYENPLLNRVKEIGLCNILQDMFFSRINSDGKTQLDNIFYLGALQTAKYLPNLIIQGQMRNMLYDPEVTNPNTKALNTFLTVTTGMTTFFSIGAIENKIINEDNKFKFVSLSLVSIISYYLVVDKDTSFLSKTGAIELSLEGAGLVALGLTGSFLGTDILHRVGIDKNLDKTFLLKTSMVVGTGIASGGSSIALTASIGFTEILLEPIINYIDLEKIILCSFDLINIISLSTITTSALSSKKYDTIINEVGRIAGFSLAKAVAVTAIEASYDHMDNICLTLGVESICNQWGITGEHLE